jgi:FdhD protein
MVRIMAEVSSYIKARVLPNVSPNPDGSFVRLPVFRSNSVGAALVSDSVAVEEPLEILVGGRNLAITMRTPGHDSELAAGFLFTEGLLKNAGQIRSITEASNQVSLELTDPADPLFERQDRRFAATSACGVCGKASIDSLYATGCAAAPAGTFAIDGGVLCGLPAILKSAQTVFHQTGGIHAAGLFDCDGNLELVREDVGRHNAVDKLIGALFLGGNVPAHDRMLLVSGRASFELVQKAAMAGIPLMAAVGAPSSLAVETAQRFGMTLAGFLRDDRFNIYCGPERIYCQPPPST